MNSPAKEQARRRGTSVDIAAVDVGVTGNSPPRTGEAGVRAAGSYERKLAMDRALRRSVRWRYASLGWSSAYLLRRLVLEGPVHVGDSTMWLTHSLIKRRFAVLDGRGTMHATESGREAVLNPHLDRRGRGPSPKYPDKVEYYRVEIPPKRSDTSFWELNTDPLMAEVLKRRREESARCDRSKD